MTDNFDIGIAGDVPIIQHVTDGLVFSNHPDGWVLFVINLNGDKVELARGNCPTSDYPAPPIAPGETYVVEPPL